MLSPLTPEPVVALGDHAATVFSGRVRQQGDTKARLERLLSSVTGNITQVSDVSERRSAPILDFWTGISGSAPGYAFLGVIGRMDHRGCESCREDATGPRYCSVPERRIAGNTCRGPVCRAVDFANRRCPRSAGRGRHFLWHVAKRFCR